MELFEEQGFDDTTAVQIAERARVTTRTFFRYFSDKQEVLFADEDMLREALVHEMLHAPDVAEPLEAVTRTLAGFRWEDLGTRESLRRRDAMIASTPYLLERELIKQHQMAAEFGNVLHQRGVAPEAADLAAAVGVQVFRAAYRQWLHDAHQTDLVAATESAMTQLATIVPAGALTTPRKASAARPTKANAGSQAPRRDTATPLR